MPTRREPDTLIDAFKLPAEELVRSPTAVIEVVFERETFSTDQERASRPVHAALEIWSRNRIYKVDSSMKCFEVRHRKTGRLEKDHQVLGALLGGGQRRYGGTMHIARPYPVPGTEAVFQDGGNVIGLTSKVERVVLRIMLTTFVTNQPSAWDDVTSALLMPQTLAAPKRRR